MNNFALTPLHIRFLAIRIAQLRIVWLLTVTVTFLCLSQNIPIPYLEFIGLGLFIGTSLFTVLVSFAKEHYLDLRIIEIVGARRSVEATDILKLLKTDSRSTHGFSKVHIFDSEVSDSISRLKREGMLDLKSSQDGLFTIVQLTDEGRSRLHCISITQAQHRFGNY